MTCEREHICNDKLPSDEWRIDYSSKESFHNWVDPNKLNLTCVDPKQIGLMGSLYFAGFAASSAFVPNLGDRYGRKWPYFVSILIQTIAYLGIFFSKSLSLTITLFFFVGLCAGGRVAIGTYYLNEFIPERK